jgi:hypothetical protein
MYILTTLLLVYSIYALLFSCFKKNIKKWAPTPTCVKCGLVELKNGQVHQIQLGTMQSILFQKCENKHHLFCQRCSPFMISFCLVCKGIIKEEEIPLYYLSRINTEIRSTQQKLKI